MANAHKHRQRILRSIDDELAHDFDAAAKRAGSDRSNITRAFWEWYVSRPGAQIPERPQQVHHLDGDPRNNDPGNLEVRDQPEDQPS